jgi:hypothetical protein
MMAEGGSANRPGPAEAAVDLLSNAGHRRVGFPCLEPIRKPYVLTFGTTLRVILRLLMVSISHSTVSPFLNFIATASALGKFTYH